VFIWRNAIVLGVGFMIVGTLYFLLQGNDPTWLDGAGVTLLVLLGGAMAFTFAVLLRGSRGL
jgi:hypothetical protein